MTAPAPAPAPPRRLRTRAGADTVRAAPPRAARATSATAYADTAIPIPSLSGRTGTAGALPVLDRPARPTARPRWSPAPSPLTVTRPVPRSRAPRAPFVILLLLLMGAGLMCLLLLNTALAQNAFRVHDLQIRSSALADEEQALSMRLDGLSDPASLAARATQLGMVPSGMPEYLSPGAPLPAGARVIDTDPFSGVVTIVVPPPGQTARQAPATSAPAGNGPAGGAR
ncbi:hypothetical protein [Frankia sp. Cppng1_Ct_nod]|uniref:hypothetical protein n=1 Tax=Frankia sp. Cppng1_Ct_nod TaxID=2897162 RepID=UPI001040F0FB|nr:hypothetical protein [Frankia sp. Cppng1_Ct_nod]